MKTEITNNLTKQIIPQNIFYNIFIIFIICISFIIYVSFGIYYLVDNFNILEICPSSHIWKYVITSVTCYSILYFNYIIKNYYNVSNKINLICLSISVIVALILIIYGVYSIYDYKEDCEYGDKLWTFSIATIILHIIYIIYGFISYLGYLLPVEIYPLEDLESKPEELESKPEELEKKPEDLESKPEDLEINNIDKDNYLFNFKISQETEV